MTNLAAIAGKKTTRRILRIYPRREDKYMQQLHAAATALRTAYADREFEFITANAAGSTLWRDTSNKLQLFFVKNGKIRKAGRSGHTTK